jgi:hypothetical protein
MRVLPLVKAGQGFNRILAVELLVLYFNGGEGKTFGGHLGLLWAFALPLSGWLARFRLF